MHYKKAGGDSIQKHKHKFGIQDFWNNHIMERFIRANLFMICCVAAGLLLIVYLGAFSCEVSWILEAHGNLPVSAYILCTQYFVVFVATTILIHGLVTGLSWGLFAWSIVIGLLSIPELVFVMIMTTQHWGLQSVHGLTELIMYLVRLVINCFALICVIPTGIKWRRETQVLSQLQDLASRLQIQTPPPSMPICKGDSRRASTRMQHSAFDNGAFQMGTDLIKLPLANGKPTQTPGFNLLSYNNNNNNLLFGSQNEFNASLFTPSYMQQYHNNSMLTRNGIRTQSLMDLRCTLPGMYNPRHVLEAEEKNGKYFNISIEDLKHSLHDSSKYPPAPPSVIGSAANDPIYCSIEATPTPPPQRHTKRNWHENSPTKALEKRGKLKRNCVSLENLEGIAKIQQELQAAAFGQNLLHTYTQQQQQYYLAMLTGQLSPLHNNVYRATTPLPGSNLNLSNILLQPTPLQRRGSQQQIQYYSGFGYANYTNPYITANSKLSLGNESDDYRKYRDVAL